MKTIYLILVTLVGILSLVAVFNRDIFRAATALVFAFIFLGGIYLLLGAEFLAVVQLIIYAGAIAILILFAIMHSPAKIKSLQDASLIDFKPHYVFTSVLAVFLIISLFAVFFIIFNDLYSLGKITVNNIKLNLSHFTNVFFNISKEDNVINGGKFFLLFESAGILILAAILAAVSIAKKD
ncbi:MAG: NADH-quinone oxidoreductase subunit J family protein [bacterium]